MKAKSSLEKLKKTVPKIVFYTDRIRIHLISLQAFDYCLKVPKKKVYTV